MTAFRVLYLAMISFATVSRKAFWHGMWVGVGHPHPTAVGKDPGACLPTIIELSPRLMIPY